MGYLKQFIYILNKIIYILNKINIRLKRKIDFFIHIHGNKTVNVVNLFCFIIVFFMLFDFFINISCFFGILPQDIKNYWNLNITFKYIYGSWVKWIVYKHSELAYLKEFFIKRYLIFYLLQYILYIFYFIFLRAVVGLMREYAVYFLKKPKKGKTYHEYFSDLLSFKTIFTWLLSLWIITSFLFYVLFYFCIYFILFI